MQTGILQDHRQVKSQTWCTYNQHVLQKTATAFNTTPAKQEHSHIHFFPPIVIHNWFSLPSCLVKPTLDQEDHPSPIPKPISIPNPFLLSNPDP